MNDVRSARYTYLIDDENRIVSVNGDWLKYAEDNNVTELTDGSFIGKYLFDFFSNPEVIHIYEQLLDRVREQKNLSRYRYAATPRQNAAG